MKKIAFCNAKGGVAKTTSAVNIGAGLSQLGYQTIIIDLDTQGQIAPALGIKTDKGLAELFANECSLDQAITKARDNLDIIPGGQNLAGTKRLIARRDMRPEMALAEVLQKLNRYDFCLLDTAPSWDVLNVNCLFYTDLVAVPVSMEVLALQGIAAFVQTVDQVKKYRHDLEIKWIIPTFYDGRVKKSEEILDQLKKYFAHKVTQPIRYNVRLSESPGHGQHIFEYARTSHGAEDYAKLIERILNEQ